MIHPVIAAFINEKVRDDISVAKRGITEEQENIGEIKKKNIKSA